MWLIVFARGLCPLVPVAEEPMPLPVAIEFLRTLPLETALLTLSRLPLLGRDEVVLVMCSFC